MLVFLLANASIPEALSFASANPHCMAYGGLALGHGVAALLHLRHRHPDHAAIYACCSSLYGWLSVLDVLKGH